jgi:hypothetical protein
MASARDAPLGTLARHFVPPETKQDLSPRTLAGVLGDGRFLEQPQAFRAAVPLCCCLQAVTTPSRPARFSGRISAACPARERRGGLLQILPGGARPLGCPVAMARRVADDPTKSFAPFFHQVHALPVLQAQAAFSATGSSRLQFAV